MRQPRLRVPWRHRHADGERQVVASDHVVQRLRVLCVRRPDDHDLPQPGMVGGEVGQHVRHGTRRLADGRTAAGECALDARRCRRIWGQVHETQQVGHRHRTGGRLGAVVVLLHPQQDARVVTGRREPSARDVVPEPVVELRLEIARPLQPRRLAGGLEQLEQSPGQIRVILGIRVDGRVACPPAAQQGASIGIPQRVAEELRCPLGRTQPRRGLWTLAT